MERKTSGEVGDSITGQLLAHLKLGADQNLLDLFGQDRGSTEDRVAEIDSGRQELFARGVFTQDDPPNIDAEVAEVLAVTDHGEIISQHFSSKELIFIPS
jgi:hypothetical protein